MKVACAAANNVYDDKIERLYIKNHKAYLRIAYYYLRSTDKAEDAVQDTFMSLLRIYKTLRHKSEEELDRYLKRAVKHQSLNIIRKDRHECISLEALCETEGDPTSTMDVEDIIGNEELRRLAFEALSEEQRACLILREVWGLDDHEVAELLHVKAENLPMMRHRARMIMIRVLREAEGIDKEPTKRTGKKGRGDGNGK